tara:strand:- start:814 stop:1707 length:894 start_codon:yes stop_codon:yes gene_type:complete
LIFFSIVIPTFNRKLQLERAIKSVINQTYNNWELIIIDNNSIDGTEDLIKNINNSKIKFYQINNNGIIAKSRNLGIKKSNGEYVCFLDSDDWWYNDKLFKLFKNINGSDFLYHNMDVYSNGIKTSKKMRVRKVKKPVVQDLLINANAIINSTVCVKTKILKEVGMLDESEDISSVEDYDLWLRIGNKTDNFKLINENLGGYEIHENNMSNFSIDSIKKIEKVYEKNIKYISESKKRIAMSTKNYTIGRIHYELNDFSKARQHFFKSFGSGVFEFKMKSLLMILLSIYKNLRINNDKN